MNISVIELKFNLTLHLHSRDDFERRFESAFPEQALETLDRALTGSAFPDLCAVAFIVDYHPTLGRGWANGSAGVIQRALERSRLYILRKLYWIAFSSWIMLDVKVDISDI